eukprot:CCRYP_014420-RA/>CCRYP_014420-RA protein AED:0.27 eAED:0.89 QI:0/0/0/1/0/0/3/0/118
MLPMAPKQAFPIKTAPSYTNQSFLYYCRATDTTIPTVLNMILRANSDTPFLSIFNAQKNAAGMISWMPSPMITMPHSTQWHHSHPQHHLKICFPLCCQGRIRCPDSQCKRSINCATYP